MDSTKRTDSVNSAMQKMEIGKLRPWQEEVLPTILDRKDVLIVQTTSGGKSLLYQIPAIMEDNHRLTIVISPLRALQENQVAALQQHGVRAVALNADLSPIKRKELLASLRETALLYLAPEQLKSQDLLSALQHCAVSRVVVDEAHVLPQDGLSFRKSYREIGNFIHILSDRPEVIACTATATPKERKEIIRSLEMESPECFVYPIRRDNLRLQIKRVESRKGHKDELEKNIFRAVERELFRWNGTGSVLVYAPTVQRVKHLKRWLKGRGWNVAHYTGKMALKKRRKAQADFLSGKKPILIATNAFGLGIDKPNVRLIIHAGLPLTLNGYVQEIGRAGRDGKKARCILFYSRKDFSRNERILKGCGSKKAVRRALKGLNALRKMIDSSKCIWNIWEKYYGESPRDRCGHCSRCISKA